MDSFIVFQFVLAIIMVLFFIAYIFSNLFIKDLGKKDILSKIIANTLIFIYLVQAYLMLLKFPIDLNKSLVMIIKVLCFILLLIISRVLIKKILRYLRAYKESVIYVEGKIEKLKLDYNSDSSNKYYFLINSGKKTYIQVSKEDYHSILSGVNLQEASKNQSYLLDLPYPIFVKIEYYNINKIAKRIDFLERPI